jgi:hypothetical protein
MNSVFALIEKRGEIYCAPGYVTLVRAVMCKDPILVDQTFSAIVDQPARHDLILSPAHPLDFVRRLVRRHLPGL